MAIDPKIIDQYNLLLQSLPDVRVHPADWLEREEDYEYLYREDTLLTREADTPAVAEFLVGNFDLRQLDPDSPEDEEDAGRILTGQAVGGRLLLAERPIQGLTRLRLAGLRDADGSGSVPDVLARLDAAGIPAGTVRPEAVLHICGNCCPAHEPLEVPQGTVDPVPPVAAGCDCEPPCDGAGVTVNVVDTGWIEEAAQRAWLHGVTGDVEVTLDPGTGEIKDYGGHGTFVTGCVRVIAPKATVYVDGSMTSGGAQYETELVAQLEEALLRGDPDRVVVFPFTTTTRDGGPLTGFDALYENVIRQKQIDGMVIISSAGCDNTTAPSWPAAYKWVVSVGSLAPGAQPVKSDFSNHGPFVDVYVLGEDLVNAYATGTLVLKENHHHNHRHDGLAGEERVFDGMAEWSGTSFSTGLLAGMVAARKSHTGETARAAAEALLDLAETQFVNGLGPVLRLDQACVPPQ
jgi:Subtilase family